MGGAKFYTEPAPLTALYGNCNLAFRHSGPPEVNQCKNLHVVGHLGLSDLPLPSRRPPLTTICALPRSWATRKPAALTSRVSVHKSKHVVDHPDIAVLKVDADSLDPITIGDSDKVIDQPRQLRRRAGE